MDIFADTVAKEILTYVCEFKGCHNQNLTLIYINLCIEFTAWTGLFENYVVNEEIE